MAQATIDRSAGWCFDIRTPRSRSSACFTKSYSRYIKGTGSVLLLCGQDAVAASRAADTVADARLGHIKHHDTHDHCGSAPRENSDSSSSNSNNNNSGNTGDSNNALGDTSINGSNDPADRVFNQDWWADLTASHTVQVADCGDASGNTACSVAVPPLLRFFSPRELTRLFGFPEHFAFPPQVGARKRYELVGNSLSVVVAGHLLDYLLRPRVVPTITNNAGAVNAQSSVAVVER